MEWVKEYSNKGFIPPRIIGYNIMQEFLNNNPEVSTKEWVVKDARIILEKSGYIEKMAGE